MRINQAIRENQVIPKIQVQATKILQKIEIKVMVTQGSRLTSIISLNQHPNKINKKTY